MYLSKITFCCFRSLAGTQRVKSTWNFYLLELPLTDSFKEIEIQILICSGSYLFIMYFIYLSVNLSVYIYLSSIYLSIQYISIYLVSKYLSSIYLSIQYLSICLVSIYLSSIYLSIQYLSIQYLSIYLVSIYIVSNDLYILGLIYIYAGDYVYVYI